MCELIILKPDSKVILGLHAGLSCFKFTFQNILFVFQNFKIRLSNENIFKKLNMYIHGCCHLIRCNCRSNRSQMFFTCAGVFKNECAKLRALRALRALAPCMPSRLTCSRVLRTLAPYVPSCLACLACALVPCVSCVLCMPSCLTCIKVYLVGCF